MITVNPATRQFNIPGSDLVFGVESDSNSVIKEFQCPRYVGNNLDLTGCFIRMNYRNANGEIDSKLIENVSVEGSNIVFGWELTPKVTMYKGNINFVMCAIGPDTKVAWHTTLGRGQVLEGLEPDSHIAEEGTADVVAQLIAMVEAQTEAVAAEGDKQIKAVQSAAKTAQDNAVAQVEAKGVNVRESIPDDYTALSETVDSLVRGRAGAIVCEAEGTAIAVKDASDMAVQGLRIFGRSTQDGIPTLDAPIEIVSVDSHVVNVHGKNLFPVYPKATTRGITLTQEPGGWIVLNGTATSDVAISADVNIPVGTYFLAANNDVGVGETFADSPYMAFRNESRGWVTSNPFTRANYTRKVEVTENVTTILLAVPTGLTLNNWRARFHLEIGEAGTEFEEHKPTQTIAVAHTLHGLAVTDGGNYIDENGQRWICDEVDLERGVHIQRISRRVYDGTEVFDIVSAEEKGLRVVTDWLNVSYPNSYILCSHMRNKREIPGITQGLNSRPSYFIPFATVKEWTDFLAEQYANGTPMVAMVPLVAPVETPLSETELAAYRALHTNKPNTTILNDSGAHMSVRYVADTKLYIDNKIAALMGNI